VPDAYFFTPFVKWGLAAEACSSVSFTRIIGRQKAASLILATERMTAQELESAGLITKIFPKEAFMNDVMAIARRIAALPSGALAFNKRVMMTPIRDELLAANERECEGLRQRARTDEPREAVKGFEEEKKIRRGGNKIAKL
jgi:Delta3-Delta2-enoyl-CoA isomerase